MVEAVKRKSRNSKKIVAITMGDPGGVGPELSLSLFKENKKNPLLLIGDYTVFEKARILLEIERELCFVTDLSKLNPYKINVLDTGFRGTYSFKNTSADNGKSAFLAIKKSIELAMKREVEAIVTAPISKHGLHLAGYDYQGHTEILAKFTNSEKYRMLFVSKHFKVLLHTIHEPVSKVVSKFKEINLEETVLMGYEFLRDYYKIKKPVIYVAGLNPHAGENGKIGSEEEDVIKPLIKKLSRMKNLNLKGPFPPDTLFFQALENKPDMIIAMYHDQGLIPLKLLDFYNAVNVTVGIPFVRTSPDHGTAFDIAWLRKFDNRSFKHAIKLAFELSSHK